ncbi:Adenosine deaminase 2 [Hondaea fermentalgiana]|uniref:Adenosine deaminase 2 n=1 Tax=Hondaea fermentalgiana TaxID=2315210 RepID=A0A2R5GYD0_9STRA|nr:Adenosine deaminase 2 [Hondaea fermentalgiana]|eukprot:GBG33733.1 Adenosine deaminase 2 [Hondaea fermentalgiana]
MSSALFEQRKEALRKQVLLESFHSVDYDLLDSEVEKRAEKAFDELLRNDEGLDPSDHLMHTRRTAQESPVFKVLEKMPKGALLHTHGIATGPFESLVKRLQADDLVYIYVGPELDEDGAADVAARAPGSEAHYEETAIEGEIRYMTNREATNHMQTRGGWVPISDLDEVEVLAYLQVPPDTPRDKRWTVFQHCWNRVRELSDALPLWDGRDSYFWDILTQLLKTGVNYVEIKQLIPVGFVKPENNGERINREATIDEFMDTFIATVELFKKENPTFVGAKMVWSALKVFSPEVVRENVDTVLRLEEKYPGWIAGFDLVGHEDSLKPISTYVDALAYYKDRGGRLLLHAGETIDPNNEQLYDAIALGCERIGHAYALPKHPSLVRIVKERGITVECCPMSNQCLGYVDDLRNHPGLMMLNAGVKITISSDDAATFGYDDVTYDFALVAKAWGLTLAQLKHLARASFRCSTLDHDAVLKAQAQFDKDWSNFLKSEVVAEHLLK